MNSTDLIEACRRELDDTVDPFLWAVEELIEYMDDAQKMFCRLTGGIADATTPGVAVLQAKTGKGMVTLSPLVLKVRGVFDAQGRSIELVNFEDLEAEPCDMRAFYSQERGPVRRMVIGMDDSSARLLAVPSEDQPINMIVYRLPLDDITAEGQDLEIAEQHRLALLRWMAHRAYSKKDSETYDVRRAAEARTAFEGYCALAKDEKLRREHKHRAVQFSW